MARIIAWDPIRIENKTTLAFVAPVVHPRRGLALVLIFWFLRPKGVLNFRIVFGAESSIGDLPMTDD